MKNFTFLTLLILLICSCCFSLSACGATDNPDESGEFIVNSLKYALCEDGTYSVLGFAPEADKTSAIIEKQINKKPVTVIKEKAFLNCTELKNLTIPQGLKVIEDMAFNGCTALSDVFIPEGVVSIGEAAFSPTVKNISVPDSIEKADYFIDTTNALFASNTIYNELNGDKYLGNASNPYVVLCSVGENATNYSVNEKTKIIGYSAFLKYYDSALVSVNIPDGVKSIATGAFQACDKLANINFPDGIKYIGRDAFKNCFSLTNVTLPDSVKSIGSEAFGRCIELISINLSVGITSIEEWTFSDCFKLTSITIPANVTIIGRFAFRNCNALTSITIPDGVTIINPKAFINCTTLTTITIPGSTVTIGDAAFSGCYNVEKAEVSPANKNYYSKNNCIIEKSTKTLKFACKNSVIPENGEIIKISDSAFRACDESCFNSFNNALYFKSENNEFFVLVKANDKEISSCEINAETRIIADSAFRDCKNLTTVTIPSGITQIGDEAFYECRALKSVHIPKSVTHIGRSAFACLALENITFDGTIKEWNAIEKLADWNEFAIAQKVICSDGSVDL